MILTRSISGKYTKANNKTRVKWLNAFDLWMVLLLDGWMVKWLNGWMVWADKWLNGFTAFDFFVEQQEK